LKHPYTHILILCCLVIVICIPAHAKVTDDPTDCDVLVLVPDDIHVCFDEEFNLEGEILGDFDDYVWIENFGETSYDLDETVSVEETTVFTLVAWYQSEENIIVNGDFEDGNTGFTSDYVVGSFSCFGLGYLDCEGTYDVIDNPNDGHDNFAACSDADGGGNMMVVNGAANFQEIWCQEVCVNEGTEYNFSAWAASVNAESPAELQFSIDGNLIGDLFSLTSDLCNWEEFEADWTASASTTVEICVTNQNTAASGNDFALDNIAFYQTCMDQASFTVTVSDFEIDLLTPEDLDCTTDLTDGLAIVDPPGQYDFELIFEDDIVLEENSDELYFELDMAGEYILLITDEHGCQLETDFEVEEDREAPGIEIIGSDVIDCDNDHVLLSADSDARSVIFNWYDENFDFIIEDDEIEINSEGLYYATAVDPDNGCMSIDSVIIMLDNNIPELTLIANGHLNCQNTSVLLNANHSGITIDWLDSNNSIIASGTDSITIDTAGVYTASVTDANGCSTSEEITVSYQQSTFQYDVEFNPVINCYETVSTIEFILDTTLYSINFESDSIVQNTLNTFASSGAGALVYEIVDSLGCTQMDSIVITEDFEVPEYTIISDSISCLNAEASLGLSSADPMLTVQWYIDGDTLYDHSIDVSQAGNYAYSVIADNGCSEDGQIEVVAVDEVPDISLEGQDISCSQPEPSLSFTSSVASSDLYWIHPDSSVYYLETTIAEMPGIYTLVFTDLNECVFMRQIEIDIDTIVPDIELPPNVELNCPDSVDTGNLVTTALNPSIQASGNWLDTTTLAFTLSMAGLYEVELTAQNGCTTQASINVSLDTIGPAVALQDSFLIDCSNEAVTIIPEIASEYNQIQWMIGSASSTNPEITVDEESSISLIVTSDNGCSSIAESRVIADFEEPEFSIITDTITCQEPEAEILLMSEEDNLRWLSSTNPMDTFNQDYFFISEPGTFSVTAIGMNGCEQVRNFEVSADTASISFMLSADTIDCASQSTMIEIESDDSINALFVLTPQGQMLDDISTALTEPGVYTVSVESDNGCTSRDSIEIISNTEPPVLIDILYEELSCLSAVLLLDLEIAGGNPPYQVLVDGQELEIESLPLQLSGAGLHEFLITDSKSCETSSEIMIEEIESLEITPLELIELAVNADYQLELEINRTDDEISFIEWTPMMGLSCYDCTRPQVTGSEDINYTVRVTDLYGCMDSINVNLRFSRQIRYFIPNVISLGTNTNNRFTIFSKEGDILAIQSMRIYDRWGNLVFENIDFPAGSPEHGWDGYFEDSPSVPGVYFYVAELLLADGELELVAGDLTLIR